MHVPFLDPGVHSLDLTVVAAGTPLTRGRVLKDSSHLEIGLISARLVSVGSQ